ncbi:hypothetical protein [Streptomyces sp. NPDC058678]|uniref:hypothetical protein n=1 Tax=Streptomyces sp. NPDC058678 TaxID=3346595 RepID=UPI0036682799
MADTPHQHSEDMMVLINEELKGCLTSQAAAAARLDTKLTLFLGFVVAAVPLLISNRLEWISGTVALVLLGLTFVLFLAGLLPRNWRVVPEPTPFVELFGASTSRASALGYLIDMREDAYRVNRNVALGKRARLRQGLCVLVVAMVLSGVSIKLGQAEVSDKPKHSQCLFNCR